jgi:hypothetical protein
MMTQEQANNMSNSMQEPVNCKMDDSASVNPVYLEYEIRSKFEKAVYHFLQAPSEVNKQKLLNTIRDYYGEYQRIWMEDRVRVTIQR